ncbi:MAG: hypothetical protein EBZ48_05260, partial [Proteobacteria bacterium]|nr:hypothetical protein [Pseudomonadota bacterium]
MKDKLVLTFLLGILATASAETYNIADQDNNLFLGFYAADEVATKSVLINIGTSADVYKGFSLDLSSASSALSSAYGTNWFNNSQVYWGLIGYDGAYGNYGSVYVARPTIQPLLNTDVLGSTSLSEDQYWTLSDKIGALINAHTAGAGAFSTVLGSAGKTHQISIMDNFGSTFNVVAGGNFSTFTASVYEQIIGGGLSIQQFTYDGSSSFPTVETPSNRGFASIGQSNGIIRFFSGGSGGGGGSYTGPWNWTNGTGNWGSSTNWTSNQVASNGFAVGITGGGGTITNDAVTNLSSLTFSNGAGSYTLTGTNAGQTLTISGGITNNSAATQTIDLALNTTSNQTFNAASGNLTLGAISNTAILTLQEGAGKSITAGGQISGNGSLVQSGSGTLNLNASNNYSGGTMLNGGTVVVGNSGSFGSGGISVASNAVIAAGTSITLTNALGVSNGATAALNNAGNAWVQNGAISGQGGIALNGAGTTTLGASNSYAGGTTLTGGTVVAGNNNSFGSGSISVASSSTIAAGTATLNTTNAVAVASGQTATLDTAGNAWTQSGSVSGNGGVTKMGTGTLSF